MVVCLTRRIGRAALRSLIGFAAAGLGFAAAPVQAATIRVLDSARRVEVEIVETTAIFLPPPGDPLILSQETFSDADEAPDAGPWDATAQLEGFDGTLATQVSELGPSVVLAAGSARSQAPPLIPADPAPASVASVAHAGSFFSVRVEIDEAMAFLLSGSVVTSGFAFAGNPEARIALRGPDAALVADLDWTLNPECDPFVPDFFCELDPQQLEASGVLEPGVFTLEAHAIGDAATFRFADQSFGDVGSAAFEVELVLLPEPSLLTLRALGAGAFAGYARLSGTALRAGDAEPMNAA